MSQKYDYDLFVIGGGSGGVRMARWSASLGARVAICEEDRFGGTCVIRGCVPKKFMVYAAEFQEEMELMRSYGWSAGQVDFSWSTLTENRDREVARLSKIYTNILNNNSVEIHPGKGKLIDPHTVEVAGKRITAKNIVIAVGGKPFVADIPGMEHALTSNEFFQLEQRPKRVIVAGGGYIAIELAGILNGLGTETSILIRRDRVLRGFDEEVRTFIQAEIEKKGIEMITDVTIEKVTKEQDGLHIHTSDGEIHRADTLLNAMGRVPYLDQLNLEAVGIATEKGKIVVDEKFTTNVPSIYAIGDCANTVNLTPVATTEGTHLAEHLFNQKDFSMDYKNIPSAVFSQPPIATVGVTEEEARARYEEIDVYTSEFRALKFSLSEINERTFMKLIVEADSQKVVGLHMVGHSAPEIIQGFGVAIKAGATKRDFDRTIGVHPSSAEEFVTMRTKAR